MDCIFCKILKGEIPAKVIYQDQDCLAFHDIEPQAPVHFLVIPKTHIPSVGDISPDQAEIVGRIFRKIPDIAQSLGVDSYRIVNNKGAQAGQTVFHLHFHVLGGREMSWPPG